MNTIQLLSLLKDRGIRLQLVQDSRLRLKARKKGSLTAEIKDLLRDHKQEIIEVLKTADQASNPNRDTISPRSRDQAPPLSFAQERLCFVEQLEPGKVTYHMPQAYQVRGFLQPDILERSLRVVIKRHQSLRMGFLETDGQVRLEIPQEPPWSLCTIDLSGLDSAQGVLRSNGIVSKFNLRPFQLCRPPLFRATVIRLSPRRHLLLFNMHHIISDGWSQGIAIAEWTTLYNGLAASPTAPMPTLAPLPIQYPDFAAWQRRLLSGHVLEMQSNYWKNRLAGLVTMAFPTDRPRPARETHNGSNLDLHFPKPMIDALKVLAEQHQASLFMVLLASLKAVLSRYTGQTDIIVGCGLGNRNRPEIEPLIGLFVNLLTMRTDLAGNPSFAKLLERVKDTTLQAYQHQDVPFEQVVAACNLPRDLSRHPLFQIQLVYANVPLAAPALENLQVTPFDCGKTVARMDFTIFLFEGDSEITGYIEYNRDLFNRDTMARLAAHLKKVLNCAAADPAIRLGDLPMWTSHELLLLEALNRTETTHPREEWLHRGFEQLAAQRPNEIALASENQTLNYAQLNARADQLAYDLQCLGAGPEVLVGLCMERSMDMVVGLLAILKAGSAYVPLEPSYPRERLTMIVADAGIQILLTTEALRPALPPGIGAVICMDTGLPSKPSCKVHVPVRGENTAYVIYTSGSTGKPKGVANVHAAISNRLLWMQAAYPLRPGDRVLQKTPFSFDVSVWEFFWPLMTGATLVLARPEGHRDSAYLTDLIVEKGVTHLHFVPSMLRTFLEEPAIQHIVTLRVVFCSGEVLPPEVADQFLECLPAVALHNLYGPTEAAVDVTYWQCRPKDDHTSVPIGCPIANTRIYLLDATGRTVPLGAVGELCIGGRGLARGYLNQPAATAAAFIPSPFSAPQAQSQGNPEPSGARLYRSGDLARFIQSGPKTPLVIEFLGRTDFQVKIRGFRIELGEIEALLAQHAMVTAALVIARPFSDGDQRIVAYVVLEHHGDGTACDFAGFLRQKLPDYMIPSAFVTLATFPLTANGKIDRAALPDPTTNANRATGGDKKPKTPTEKAVTSLWCEVLGVPEIGTDDNFFNLGGHSLMLARVIARLKKTLQVNVPMDVFFQYPTVAGLAQYIDLVRADPAEDGREPLAQEEDFKEELI